jgi:transcriptional regulator with XRE-family HTH domain
MKKCIILFQEITTMALGQRVKKKRESLKMSQGQLARQADITQGLLSRIESGATPSPGSAILKRLAIALGCSTDWLLEMYEDDPAPALAPVAVGR